MAKTRVLCFGDSLTWGFDPVNRIRFDEDNRWPRVMGKILGDDYEIIEEGQNGRTIATDDPSEGEKNGLKYIGPCLETHTPLDIVIIMLGSNDCKRKFSYSSMDIAGEMQIMLEKIKAYNEFRCQNRFKIILVSPPVISESIKDSWLGDSFGYENACNVSAELAEWYEKLAGMYGTLFVDASKVVKASDADGCHMDPDNQIKFGQTLAEFIQENELV